MNMKSIKYSILTYLGLCFIAPNAIASTFMAPHDKSVWSIERSKLVCQLNHEVPGYGMASFEQRAGERQTFALKATMGRFNQGDIIISRTKPSWASIRHTVKLAKVPAKTGLLPLRLKKMTVYQLLDGLDKGYQGKIDFIPSNLDTSKREASKDTVILSPTGFHQSYKDYVDCIAQLVPYSFDDIKQTTLRFRSGSKALSTETMQKLISIGEYANHDPDVYKVRIEGHTDSVGSFTANRRLSYERAWFIKDILVNQGVKPDLIEVKGMADRIPLARNTTAEGRTLNRRVIVRLYR